MTMDFLGSQTKENLMKAFAGESMARNRYLFGASQAKKEHQHVIEFIFRYTADQEKEHAEIFYNYLSDELKNETVNITAGYPVDDNSTILKLLRASQHNEYEEYDSIYKAFGDTAKEEGFTKIASSFHMIAAIEKTHGDRFSRFAELIENNQLYVSDIETGWICLHCGHIHWGKSAPKQCPVCSHDQGYFIRLELSPFQGPTLEQNK